MEYSSPHLRLYNRLSILRFASLLLVLPWAFPLMRKGMKIHRLMTTRKPTWIYTAAPLLERGPSYRWDGHAGYG